MVGLDLENDVVLALRDVAKRVPPSRRGKRCNISTVYRWCSRGVRGRKLQSWEFGGKRITTVRALEEFCRPVTDESAPDAPPTSAAAARADRRAAEELEEAGI